MALLLKYKNGCLYYEAAAVLNQNLDDIKEVRSSSSSEQRPS
jgi:hypothetical protein